MGLQLPSYSDGQNNPDTTINLIADILEGLADALVHDMASDADYTLATTGTEPFEWQHLVINITDTGTNLTTGRNIVVPDYTRVYIAANDTLQTLTFKTAAGSGIAVLTNTSRLLRCDGTNVVAMPNFA